jgi:hypothetical protein
MANNMRKMAVISAVLGLFGGNAMALIDITLTPNTAWDVGTGGPGSWVSPSPYTLRNNGESVRVNVRGSDSPNWRLSNVAGVNAFAVEWGADPVWHSILSRDTEMFPALVNGEQQSFNFRYHSPTFVTPLINTPQPSKMVFTAVSQYLGSWNLATASNISASDQVMAVGPDGAVHVLFYDSVDQHLKYFKWDGSGEPAISANIEPERINMMDPGHQMAISVGLDGVPHIAYAFNDFNGNYLFRYARLSGATWLLKAIDTNGYYLLQPGQNYPVNLAFAIDGSGNPHVVFPASGQENKIVYGVSTDNGQTWDIKEVDTGASCSIKLDSNGVPHIAYHTSSYEGAVSPAGLKYAKWNPTAGQWDKVSIDNSEYAGLYPSLALDSKNNPYIAYTYYDNAGVGAVRVAKPDDKGNWGYVSVKNVEGYPSLYLDRSGYPALAFRDYSNNQVEFVRWTGTEWLSTVAGSDPSTNPSLGFDLNGRPHVVYSVSDGQIKYAMWQ